MKSVILLSLLFFLFFGGCENKHQQAMQLFEQGKLLEKRGIKDSAVFIYTKVVQYTNDKELCGKTYNYIGNLFLEYSLYPNACETFQKAFQCNLYLNDKTEASKSLRGIGKSYFYRFKPDSALYYQLKAYKLIELIKDSGEITNIYNNLASNYLYLKQYDKFETYITPSMQMTKDSSTIYSCYLLKGQFFFEKQQPDSAFFYLNKGTHSNDLHTQAGCYFLLDELAKQTGDPNHIKYMEQAQMLKDSIEALDKGADIVHIDKHLMLSQTAKEKKQLVIWIICILFFSCLIIFSLAYYHKHKVKAKLYNIQKAQKQLEELHDQLQQVTNELELLKEQKSGNELSFQREKLENILKNILMNIRKIGETSASKFMKSESYKEIKKSVSTMNANQRNQYKEQIYNEFDTYIRQLSTFVNMSKDDYFLCCLFLLAFNTKDCAVFRCLTENSIRTQKSRIREKIENAFGKESAFDFLFSNPDKKAFKIKKE